MFGDSSANNFLGRITRGVEKLLNTLWSDYILNNLPSLASTSTVIFLLFCSGPILFTLVQLYQNLPLKLMINDLSKSARIIYNNIHNN